MTSKDAVWVQHGNQQEYEVFPQQMGSHVFFIQQKFNYSIHAIAGRGLYGMNSGWNKDNGLIVPKFSDF